MMPTSDVAITMCGHDDLRPVQQPEHWRESQPWSSRR
jgi:hypothetical protein